MFPGRRLHYDKQDLSSASCDEKEQFSDSQNVSVYQNTLLSGIQEVSVVRHKEVLFSEGHDAQEVAQELSGGRVTQAVLHELLTSSQCPDQNVFQTDQAYRQDLLSGCHTSQDRGIFPEDGVAKLPDVNAFSGNFISEETVSSETPANQTQDEAKFSAGGDNGSNVEDIISVNRDVQDIIPSGNVTRRMGQNVFSGGLADQQCMLSEGHAPRQCVFPGDRTAGQEEVLTGSRLTQVLDIRTAPRQLDMGK